MSWAMRNVGQTGLRVPVLGFGGAPLGGLFDAVDDAEATATLAEALDHGMTYADTAPFYGFGRSERRVGDMLRGRDYVLSTKVGRLLLPGATPDAAALGWPDALPFHPVFDYSYDGVMRSVEASMHRLGLDRIDILYVHDIGTVTHGADNARHMRDLETGGYAALDELRRAGQVSAIGLGVNESAACLDALKIGDWDVFLLAGRYTLLEQDPLDDLLPACAARGTSIVVGGPYNSGILVGGTTWNYAPAPEEILTRVRALSELCAAYEVPLPAVALQFPLGHAGVCSVIPGLRSRSELAQTLAWAGTSIPDDLWSALKSNGLLRGDAPVPHENPYRGGPA